VLDISRKVIGLGSYTCCFSLALLSEVAMFALFQCFLIFQHSRLIYIYIYDKGASPVFWVLPAG
jgi:hypothetical protein